MTDKEKAVLNAVAALLDTYDADSLSECEIDNFNNHLGVILEHHGFSLEDYHALVIKDLEENISENDE